jgi:hypothetical protein
MLDAILGCTAAYDCCSFHSILCHAHCLPSPLLATTYKQFDDCNAIYAGDIIYIPTSSQQQHRDGVPRDQQPARSPVVDGAQDAPRDQPRTRSLGAAEIAQLARQEGEVSGCCMLASLA